MSRLVDFDSLFLAEQGAKGACGEWLSALSGLNDEFSSFSGQGNFSGKAADSIRQYVQEVHGIIIASLQEALANYFTKLTLYADGYLNGIDSNNHAVLPEDELTNVGRRFHQKASDLYTLDTDLRSSLLRVSDLLPMEAPRVRFLQDTLEETAAIAENLNTRIDSYESVHASDFQEIDTILRCVRQLISSQTSSSRMSASSYQSGGIAALTDCVALSGALQVSMQYRAENVEALQAAKEHETVMIAELQQEAADARLKQGIWTAVAAVGAVVVGAVAIVSTAGAATPAVASAVFYTAGACSAAYGVSNLVQSGQDIYYGATGDPYTSAFNPIRDTVFFGNQEAYNTWGSLNMIVAGLAVPVNSAYNAAAVAQSTNTMGSVARVVGTELGKDALSGAAGKYAGDVVYDWTGNQELSTVVGIGAGMLSSAALGHVDKKLNISGLYDPDSLLANAHAKQVLADATDAEPDITATMKSLQSDDAYLEGLDYRIKGEMSLTRKIYTDAGEMSGYQMSDAIEVSSDNIGDSLRYTLIADENKYSDIVSNSIQELESKGYVITEFKNTWDNDIYKGINMNLESPDGTQFELQFHTKSSFNTKQNLNHQYYEIARNTASTPEEIAKANEAMRYNTAQIKIPEGVLELRR